MPDTPKVEDQEAEALRRRLAELETVAAFHEEAGRLLGPAPGPAALQDLLDLIRVRFGIRSAAYLRFDEVGQELTTEAISPVSLPKGMRVKAADVPAGRVAASGKTLKAESPEKGSALAAA